MFSLNSRKDNYVNDLYVKTFSKSDESKDQVECSRAFP